MCLSVFPLWAFVCLLTFHGVQVKIRLDPSKFLCVCVCVCVCRYRGNRLSPSGGLLPINSHLSTDKHTNPFLISLHHFHILNFFFLNWISIRIGFGNPLESVTYFWLFFLFFFFFDCFWPILNLSYPNCDPKNTKFDNKLNFLNFFIEFLSELGSATH